jgi:hypothetical protein
MPAAKRNARDRADALWKRIQRMRPHFASVRRKRRYRYLATFLAGLCAGWVVQNAIGLASHPHSFADCVLEHEQHAQSFAVVQDVREACQQKYSTKPRQD